MDADRGHRVWRAAGAHRAAPGARRRPDGLDGRTRVPGRQCRMRAAARAGVHPAVDLLCLPRRRAGRRGRRRRSGSSSQPSSSSSCCRCCSWRQTRRCGSAEPAPAPERPWPPSRSKPPAVWSARALSHVRGSAARTVRWVGYLAVGVAAAALLGAYLVLALLACGLVELLTQSRLGPCALGRTVAAGVGLGRRDRRAGLDRVQGRRALVRRRVRDHPPDAGRRRAHATTG